VAQVQPVAPVQPPVVIPADQQGPVGGA